MVIVHKGHIHMTDCFTYNDCIHNAIRDYSMRIHHFSPSVCLYPVLYAGELAAKGLDVDGSLTRLDVFKTAKLIQCTSDLETQQLADQPIPFIPELSFYRVISILKGLMSHIPCIIIMLICKIMRVSIFQ